MPLPLVVAGAALNTAGTILTDIPVLGSLFNQHPEDPGRLADNLEWYNAAIRGVTWGPGYPPEAALRNLLSASGQYGAALWAERYPGLPNSTPYTAGAWATDGPRQDAFAKYQAAYAATNGAAPLRGAPTTPGGPSAPDLSIKQLTAGSVSPLVLILVGLLLLLALPRLLKG